MKWDIIISNGVARGCLRKSEEGKVRKNGSEL